MEDKKHQLQDKKQMASSPCSQARSSSNIPEEQSKRDKLAMASIRKCHSLWDRQKRSYSASVDKSDNHPNTTGCKFIQELT